ncbi:hypothetical protein RS030_6857 [Cryptosporidium xiaoi]|uniref:Bromo domain-containing protein n=1 Tax=Cryptosporidium xiaoi TaxID=659607 RepID=A0AAV9XUE4_9CRYT
MEWSGKMEEKEEDIGPKDENSKVYENGIELKELDDDELEVEIEEEVDENELGVDIENEEVDIEMDDEDDDKSGYEREDLEPQDRTDGEESLSQISRNQSETLREASSSKAINTTTIAATLSGSEGTAGKAGMVATNVSGNTTGVSTPNVEIKIPRGRGRPPRNANRADIGPSGLVSITSIWADDDKPKGKRGRPRLKPIVETEEKTKVEAPSKPYKVKRPKGPNNILLDIIHRLYKRDKQQIFAEPVNAEFVPDYYQVIKNPMDFSTMRKKVLNNEYLDFDSFNNDVRLIISNCYTYNRVGTMVYRMGLILEETWDKSIEGSKSRYEQSIINIKEHEEKKSAGEVISDSESESQPIWDQTPTSPPAGDSSNQRSMITRRMEARLSGLSNNTQFTGGTGRYGDNRTDSSVVSDSISRRTSSNYSHLGSSSMNSRLNGGIGMNNVGKSYSQSQQPKGPTLANICRGDGSSLKEALEKLKVDRFEPFNTLLRQMSTQACIKTPTIDDWYVFDKQLSNIQYRNSVKRFIGEESIKSLKKIMDIGTALLEIDPHPEVAKTPLSDLRLFGIDTEDFASFNQNLTVDNTFLLGVGENHIKLALSLQDEHPEIDLSPLRELYIKYTKNPPQSSLHTTQLSSLHTPPPSIHTPTSSLSSSSLQRQSQSKQLLMQHQQSSISSSLLQQPQQQSLNSSSTSQIMIGQKSQMNQNSVHAAAINKGLAGTYGNGVGMGSKQKSLNSSIYNAINDHSNQNHSHHSHGHVSSFSSQSDIQQITSSNHSPSNSTSNVIPDAMFESRNQGLIKSIVSPQNNQTRMKIQMNNGVSSGMINTINNIATNSSNNGYYDSIGVPHKIQKTESSQNIGLRPMSNTNGGISTTTVNTHNNIQGGNVISGTSNTSAMASYINNNVSSSNMNNINNSSIHNFGGISNIQHGNSVNSNNSGVNYNSCTSSSTSSLIGITNNGKYYGGNDFRNMPEKTSYSQSSIGVSYQQKVQNLNVPQQRYQQIIHQNKQYHSNVFMNSNSEGNIIDSNNGIGNNKNINGCDSNITSTVVASNNCSGSNGLNNTNINDNQAGKIDCHNTHINGQNNINGAGSSSKSSSVGYGSYQNNFLCGSESVNIHGIGSDTSEASAIGNINNFGMYQQRTQNSPRNQNIQYQQQNHHINVNISDGNNDNCNISGGSKQHNLSNNINLFQQYSQYNTHNHTQNHRLQQMGGYQYNSQTQVNQQNPQYIQRFNNNIQTGSVIQSNKVIHSNAPLHNNEGGISHTTGIVTSFISDNNN